MIYYGCLQPRESWFIDFNHVHSVYIHVPSVSGGGEGRVWRGEVM